MKTSTFIFTLLLLVLGFIGECSAYKLPGSKQVVGLTNNKAVSTSQDSLNLSILQEEFLSWKFGMFIHFNMATFTEREWANGYEDPASFSPDKLDCNQWATSHDITSFKNYKNGTGDIVKEFVDAFRKRGIKVGLYYCFPGDYSGRYGNI